MQKAAIGKRNQLRVRTILENSDWYAHKIRKMLINQTYRPTKPHIKVIQDGAIDFNPRTHEECDELYLLLVLDLL